MPTDISWGDIRLQAPSLPRFCAGGIIVECDRARIPGKTCGKRTTILGLRRGCAAAMIQANTAAADPGWQTHWDGFAVIGSDAASARNSHRRPDSSALRAIMHREISCRAYHGGNVVVLDGAGTLLGRGGILAPVPGWSSLRFWSSGGRWKDRGKLPPGAACGEA